MKFAIDDQDNRTQPLYSGQKATCPLCNGDLVGKCGAIYIWHWQHLINKNCDSWKEHETKWHREWKNNFPESWQEVIIQKDNNKHIADIKTPYGLVIEFQNSPISKNVIETRERFYENMIWVVNANEFKNNIKLYSLVKSRLREINNTYEFNSIKSSTYEYRGPLIGEIKEIEDSINKISIEVDDNEYKVKQLEEHSSNLEDIVKEMISCWKKGDSYYKSYLGNIINACRDKYNNVIVESFNSIIQLSKNIEKANYKLSIIKDLNTIQLDEKTYWITDYNSISSKSFFKVKAVSKSSMNTFFKDSKGFTSEYDFKSFNYHKNNYIFAIDLKDLISTCESTINNNEISIISLNSEIDLYKKEVSMLFKDLLFKDISDYFISINESKESIKELEDKLSILLEEKDRIQQFQLKKIQDYEKRQEKQIEEQRSRIMRAFKGHYGFNWKYERKSWASANCTIYFDFGESHLLKMVDPVTMKKVQIEEFIHKITNHYY